MKEEKINFSIEVDVVRVINDYYGHLGIDLWLEYILHTQLFIISI